LLLGWQLTAATNRMENQTQTPEALSTVPVSGRWAEHTLARNQYVEIPATQAARDADEEEQTPGLIEYWRILSRHKGTWIVFAFIGALLGFLIALPQTPIYQARTSLEIVGLNDNFLNFKQSNPMAESGTSSEALDIQTQIRILGSDSLLDRVSAKLKQSDASAIDVSPRTSAWRKLLNLPELPTVNAREEALKSIAKSLKVRAAGQTRIVEITADSPSAQLAAQFANTLTSEFIEQNLEARWKTTEKTSNWLARQLDGMKIRLEQSEDALQTYARNSGLLFTEEKTNVSEDKLRQLQQQLSAAQGDRISRQSRYEIAQSSPPDALPDVLNNVGASGYSVENHRAEAAAC
jgi:succinoglycan biosynthesis transport protein ExoP